MSDDDLPAPNRYDAVSSYTQSQLPGTKGLGRSAVISARPALFNGSIYHNNSPGPSHYNINSTIGDKNDRHGRYHSIARRNFTVPDKQGIPGPASYSPTPFGESDERRKKRGLTFGQRDERGSSVFLSSNLAGKLILKNPVKE
jgi:hypothetical protein